MIGLVLSYRETVLRVGVRLAAGIDLMLLAGWLSERDTGRDVVAVVGLVGAALAIGSLVGAAKGR